MEAEASGADIRLDLVSGKYNSLVYLINGRSVLWSVKIRSAVELRQVCLSISYSPGYAKPQQYWISHIEPDQPVSLRVECPEFDEQALRSITDDQPGRVCVELRTEDGSVLARREDEFRWLAYNAWAGGSEFPELLAALVLPHDPALDSIDMFARAEGKGAWSGYDDEPDAVRDKIRRLWDDLLRHNIDYELPPREGILDIGVGQRVRTPSMIRELGCSTCLDSTLLLAACLTRLRLNPIVMLIRGHSFLGVFLKNSALPTPLGTPATTLRNLLEQRELIAIETTGLNQNMSFDDAVMLGADKLNSLGANDEFEALDIEQIWHELGIHPIVGECPKMNNSGCADTPDTLVSTKPHSRMESWQRKLLDLSLRNNLLNTRDSGHNQIRLTVPDVAELEDALAGNGVFRIKSLPETYWTDKTQDEADLAERRLQEAASSMFRKRELLASDMKPAALQRSLHSLYSASRREMEESGVNTLFIACGFLRWVPKNAPVENALQAPLLLIPVQLKRTSVRDGFTLSSMESETYINHTLLELLKTEFSLRIPQLEGELPKDDSGLDVPLIFDIVRKAISGIAGWEVLERCVLGSFSFSKYLMWRDLADRRAELMRNPVVAHLAADDRGRFPDQVGFPELHRLDNEVDAHKVYTPLPSDSSQLAAILAAARGKNFVLEGPPGTGKSQTIANMIAHCLGHGKTVLFVAEKAVALEVVHKRLTRIGLGDYCLELHSNKSQLSAVMNQFRAAVARLSDSPAPNEWDESVDSMTSIRQNLNLLPQEMHRKYPDGSSLYEDLSYVAEHQGLPTLPLPESMEPLSCTRAQKQALLKCANELTAHYEILDAPARHAARWMSTAEYSQNGEKELEEELTRCVSSLNQLEEVETQIADALGFSPAEIQTHRALFVLSLQIAEAHADADWSALLPSRAGKTLRSLNTLLQHAGEYRRLRSTLSLPYPETILHEPELDTWLRECKLALTKFWPLSWWSMRKLRQILQAQAMSRRIPDCPHDLQTLVAMRTELQAVQQEAASLPAFLHMGVDTQDVHAARKLADELESACAEDEVFAFRLLEQRHRFADDRRLEQKLSMFRALRDSLSRSANALAPLLRGSAHELLQPIVSRAREWVMALLEAKSQWRHIALWNKCVQAAQAVKCGSLAEALLSEQVAPAQLEEAVSLSLALAKLKAAGSGVAILHDFAAPIHEKRIRDFANQEAALRERTGAHIRSILAKRAAGITQYDRETAVLQREISKKRMHMPLRKLLAATPHISPMLKPCFLMSPLSVAQYLAPETQPFDVVIFDEASQIPVWDAIGVIGRGSSVIICGDPHQMPPTSFFSRSRVDEGHDDEPEGDLESILDECLACGIPKMHLTWHYRSKSESLISFSNSQYYEGKMTTFPAPTIRDTALQFHYVNGLYESGSTKRINRDEACAVVQHVLDTLRQPDFRYTEATSMGVVTFNTQQQKLITDLFEEARAKDPSLEPYFAEDNSEAIFVKNLENVQGDERGVIYFSTTYGKGADGRMAMNFGPLNQMGGERRLNVAVTRARYALHVFTSMLPDDIDLSRTHARGVADLRAFLDYARHATHLSLAGVSSKERDALVQHIDRQLESSGWRCRTQVGASDYRVDIAVQRPGTEDAVLAGITFDGPAYAAAHTARDRDVVRPEAMRLLGWQMLNLWSIDWWHNPDSCLAALIGKLEQLCSAAPAEQEELPSLISTADSPAETEEHLEEPSPTPQRCAMPPGPLFEIYEHREPLPALFEMSDRSLSTLICNISEQEAPMSTELLFARLLQLAPVPHPKQSRGYKDCIRHLSVKIPELLHTLQKNARIHLHTEDAADGSGENIILSLPGAPSVLPRACGNRPLENIPLSELEEIARLTQVELRCIPGSEEHIRGMSDFLRLSRLTRKAKEFLLAVIQRRSQSA